jgi:hypothetical protein
MQNMTTTSQKRKSAKEIFNLTKIDCWFLVQIKEIVDFEEELAGMKN